MDYYEKYIKYKQKYLKQKILKGGLTINEYKNIKYDCYEKNEKNIINCKKIIYSTNDDVLHTVNDVKYYIDDTLDNAIINDYENTTWSNISIFQNNENDNKYDSIKTLFQNNIIFNNYKNCKNVNRDNIIISTHINVMENLKIIFNNKAFYSSDFLKIKKKNIFEKLLNIYNNKNQLFEELEYNDCFNDYSVFIKNEEISYSFQIIKDFFKIFKKDKIEIIDEKLFNCIINSISDIDHTYDDDNDDSNIVLFSNDLFSFIFRYKINENKQLTFIKNTLFIINKLLIKYYDIEIDKNKKSLYNKTEFYFSYRMPIKYIVEKHKCIEIILDSFYYKDKEFNNKYLFGIPGYYNDKKYFIQKNHDLLSYIHEYKNEKWNPIFNNNFALIIDNLFIDSMYIYNNTSNEVKTISEEILYRDNNRLNGNFVFLNPIKKIIGVFCDFNSLKAYINKKWDTVPYYVSWAFSDFLMSEKNEMLYTTEKKLNSTFIDCFGIKNNIKIEFIIKYTQYKSIIYIDNIIDYDKEYLISNNDRIQQCNSLVDNYYKEYLDQDNYSKYIKMYKDKYTKEIFINYELYQLLNIKTKQIIIIPKQNKININILFNVDEINEYSNIIIDTYTGNNDLLKNDLLYLIKNLPNDINKILSDIINNTKTISLCNYKYNIKSKNINIIYCDFSQCLNMNLLSSIQKFFELMFTNALLITFMNNIIFNKKEKCYFNLKIENEKFINGFNIKIIKNAIITACKNIDELGFELDIIFICNENDISEYLKDNTVFNYITK